MSFKIVPFHSDHSREGFNCGTPELDRYLKQYARQDIRKNFASLFVALKDDVPQVRGYYTLSNASVKKLTIPEPLRKGLAKYDDVPAIRLGRLAVDRSVQGQGLGTSLLANAVIRSTSNVSAWAIMIVDAKDEKACVFYRKYSFDNFIEDKLHLFALRQKLEAYFIKADREKGESL